MKQFFFFIIWAGITVAVYSLEFTIAPLYYIDETTEQINSHNNFQNRILLELKKAFSEGKLLFKAASSPRYNPPQSVLDALAFSKSEKADYLIYGFIKKNEYTIQGELRLLDVEKKEIIANIFATDNNNKEDEFITELAHKLFRFLQERYNITIIEEPPSYSYFQFPFTVGYWLPVDSNYGDLIIGIIRIETGIELILKDNLVSGLSPGSFVSFGVGVSYQAGQGQHYESITHSISVTVPIMLNVRYNDRYIVSLGIGFLYSMDILEIKKPYEGKAVEIYHVPGILIKQGWAISLGNRFSVSIHVGIEAHLYKRPMVNFIPGIGFIVRGNTGEVRE